jgi:hypothetical protein
MSQLGLGNRSKTRFFFKNALFFLFVFFYLRYKKKRMPCGQNCTDFLTYFKQGKALCRSGQSSHSNESAMHFFYN